MKNDATIIQDYLMDPLNAFITIIGLLATFKSEHESARDATIEDYLEWLRRHQHEQLLDAIANNDALSIAIQNVLARQHEDVMDKFECLENILSSLASSLSGFSEIVESLPNKPKLADQSRHILRMMHECEAGELVLEFDRGRLYACRIDGETPMELELAEVRFLDDDLNLMCSLGLLTFEKGRNGLHRYKLTRKGNELGRLAS